MIRARGLAIPAAVFALTLGVAPAAAQSGGAVTRPACDAENAGLRLPQGFCALLVADGLGSVRHLVVRANGDIIANVQGSRGGGAGGAVGLRDTNGDGKADVKEALGSPAGHGIWLTGETLYLTTNTAVLRYHLPAGSLKPTSGPDTLVSGLPASPGHPTKSVVVTSDGSLYVHIGSRTNSCQERDRQNDSPGVNPCVELETRAGIWRFDANKLRQQPQDGVRFATGLRNTNALTLNSQNGVLYGVPHGRDQLLQNWGSKGYTENDSAEKPSEIFVEIRQGDDFGWPYCYHDRIQGKSVLAPEYGGDGREVGQCAQKKQPLVGFPGHWAPNAIVFYNATQFPQSYRGGAFIAFHGSWNRAPLPQQGFNVVFQPMSGGRPSGEFSVFADGFQALQPAGRPTGVAVGPDGSLDVSDDAGGRIWRVHQR
jgi:glucose/arabinose dehydrogenase